jgi:hypothetical protein
LSRHACDSNGFARVVRHRDGDLVTGRDTQLRVGVAAVGFDRLAADEQRLGDRALPIPRAAISATRRSPAVSESTPWKLRRRGRVLGR